MPKHILTRNYSTFYDLTTKTQFHPVLDVGSGCFVGVAQVDEKTAKLFAGRPSFKVLDDEGYMALVTRPAEPEPGPSETGDPLEDAGLQSDLGGPPAPPPSK